MYINIIISIIIHNNGHYPGDNLQSSSPLLKINLCFINDSRVRPTVISQPHKNLLELQLPPAAGDAGTSSHLYVLVVAWDGHKLWQSLAEPHGDIPVHVDGERLIALLQPADGEVLEGADIFAKVHPPHLTHTQTAYWDQTWRHQNRKSLISLHVHHCVWMGSDHTDFNHELFLMMTHLPNIF